MSATRKKNNHKAEENCPVSSNEIDLIPECYHYSNRCLCFTCTCGNHICPSLKKTFYAKGSFSSNYNRSYSKPLVSKVPQRIQSEYHPNNAKMDFKTEYQNQFPGCFAPANQEIRSQTPQPNLKFEGKSQYYRDFPNWGPIEYHHNKRPVQPTHETKLKFEGTSSYKYYYSAKSPQKNMQKTQNEPARESFFQIPLQSTSQREYKAASNEQFPKHESKKIEH